MSGSGERSTTRTISAAVYRSPGEVVVEQRPLPAPAPDEVVVEVAFCGVCGTDLHMMVEGWGEPGHVFGHEWSGVVTEVGAAVGDLAPGDRVVMGATPRCGTCEACLAGRPSQCSRQDPMTGHYDGAFATHAVAPRDRLLRVPDGLDLRTAALAEPLAVALHAITRARLEGHEHVLVSGAGPIGALATAVLVHRGHTVDVVEPGAARQRLAAGLGVRAVRAPEDLARFDMAQVDSVAEPSYHVALETSGRRPAMEAAIQQLRRGGHMVVAGTGLDAPRYDPNRMVVMELSVSGSFIYDADGFERALELLASDVLPVDVLVEEHGYGLDGVGTATLRLVAGEHAGKVMIQPNTNPGRNP